MSRDEETPGERAERERLARRREDDKWIHRLERQRRRDNRARRDDIERRRSQPQLRRDYENWIQSYGTRRQREQLAQQNAVGGGPTEAEQRAWERKHSDPDGRWIGQPDPETRRRQHLRRWIDQQPTTAGGLIGLPDPEPAPPAPEPDSGDKGWSWTAGAAEALGGQAPDPPPDDDGKNASGGDGRIPW